MGPTEPTSALDAHAAAPPAEEARAPRPGPSPLVLAGVPVIVGVLLWSLFAGAVACPHDGPGTAHQRAEEDERVALAGLDRYPFAPEDGVEAVARFRRAHACYRDSGDAAGAERLRALGDAAQRRVEGDYRTRAFRLQRALEADEVRSALLEARTLRAMLGARTAAPYVDWLERLEHALALRLRRPAKQAP